MKPAPRLAHPLILIGAGLGLYLLTLAPTITGTDAGELALAAYSGGVAHAPGFPTWLILAWPVSHLPFAEPARLLNALSAVLAALTLALVWFWLRQTPSAASASSPPLAENPKRRKERRPGQREAFSARFIPLAVVFTFAAGRSFWVWANTTEVYALNTFLIAATLFCLFRWPLSARGDEGGLWLPLAALSYGLALGAHLATTALLAPAIALWLYWQRRRLRRRQFLLSTLALVLGLSVYAWLPLRAATHPLLNWGEPDTLYRFWRHITAAQYRSNISLQIASILNELRFGLTLSFWQFSPLGLPLVGWGMWWGWRQQRRLLLFVLVGVFVTLSYAVLYAIADDQDAYYILAHLLLILPLMWGLERALTWLAARWPGRRWLALASFLLPLLTLFSNMGVADRSDYWYHQDYYRNLTSEVAAGGAIFTRDWQFYSPSLYYQFVLNDRPDLRIIDVELMRRDWYLNHLERWYPELTSPAAEVLRHYRTLRDEWERDPAGFERNPQAVNALQNAYIDAINALIASAAQTGAVHLGLDMEPGVGAGYAWTPVGLTFRLDPPGVSSPALPPLNWRLEHLRGRWDKLPDDPARKVVRVHALMASNRALYLARNGETEAALAALALAEQLLPNEPLIPQLRLQIGGAP